MSSAFFLSFIALSRARLNAQAQQSSQLPPPANIRRASNNAAIQFRHDSYHWNQKDRIIVIGDVHGCADELENLLKVVEYERGKDVVMFVGDLVRKGPYSKRVIKLAREINALTVRGNHDQIAIEDTSNKLGLSEDDLDYLRNAPVTITIPEMNTILVHAGIIPSIPLEKNEPLALMNMRNIIDETKPTSSHKDGVAWVTLWNGPQHIVFGHDAKRGLQQTPFATGLDTGCVYGRKLTALILPERKLISVDSTQPIPDEHSGKPKSNL